MKYNLYKRFSVRKVKQRKVKLLAAGLQHINTLGGYYSCIFKLQNRIFIIPALPLNLSNSRQKLILPQWC
ncbi:hypothetical protein C7N43_30950 [Sphingobacteriales bacterium UPWRP_1]|nr:hypothetical protein BVG80_01770 [Sphingobacteriales bacterium TSM_CSM]PSJ73074.1 hypothetical protein C7N43_30950 [Sphingobacteriales bacterium UPWRP_1]